VLLARGLAPDVIAAAVAEAFAGTDEGAAAAAAGRRRLAALRGLARQVARRRLAGYLARRGYPAAAIASALRALLPAGAGDEPEEY
jgi:regulatory protein